MLTISSEFECLSRRVKLRRVSRMIVVLNSALDFKTLPCEKRPYLQQSSRLATRPIGRIGVVRAVMEFPAEKNLPTKWSPAGENLAWKAPYGGRSAPIVMGDRLYLLNGVGAGPTLRERLVCLNADTGKLIWEYAYNVFLSDVPPHRIAWSSPAGDPETGNITYLEWAAR